MGVRRREFLSFATVSFVAAGASAGCVYRSLADDADDRVPFNVRSFGAVADGKAVDTPAVNRAIAAAALSKHTRNIVPLAMTAMPQVAVGVRDRTVFVIRSRRAWRALARRASPVSH